MEQKLQEIIDKAQAKFKENNCYYEMYPYMGLAVAVEINWGDWKHDHAYVDWVMKEIGAIKFGEEETETDGSDCYSSIHYFIPKPTI